VITEAPDALHTPSFTIIHQGTVAGAGRIAGFGDKLHKGVHVLDTNVFTLYPGAADSPEWSVSWRHSGHPNAKVLAYAKVSATTYDEETMLDALRRTTGSG